MRSGLLRSYADIEYFKVTGTGDRGQPTGAWTKLYTSVPMALLAMTGRELEISRQLVGQATHKVTMRYLSGIDTTMRVNFGGRIFHIGYINEGDFRQRYLSFITFEQQTGG